MRPQLYQAFGAALGPLLQLHSVFGGPERTGPAVAASQPALSFATAAEVLVTPGQQATRTVGLQQPAPRYQSYLSLVAAQAAAAAAAAADMDADAAAAGVKALPAGCLRLHERPHLGCAHWQCPA